MYKIYTDGACEPNPGSGGWAFVILKSDEKLEQGSGYVENTTNNRMEITAVIEGLKTLEFWSHSPRVEIYSDSTYVVNTFELGWINKWMRNGWHKSKDRDSQPIKNADLWKELLMRLSKTAKFKFIHINGHCGFKWNELCDSLAEEAAQKLSLAAGIVKTLEL